MLGQTLDGMRVWDIRGAVRALNGVPGLGKTPVTVSAHGNMAVNAAYAAIFEPQIKILLTNYPASQRYGPDYLNVLKYMDTRDVITLLGPRAVAPAPLQSGMGFWLRFQVPGDRIR